MGRATAATAIAVSRWRWASIVLALAIAALRPDLPVEPLVLLTGYFLLTTILLYPLHLSLPPQLLGLADIAMLSIMTAIGGGERSPVYIVYLTSALDIGTRVVPWQAGALAAMAAVGYALAAWGASLGGTYPFDPALAPPNWNVLDGTPDYHIMRLP